MSIYISAPLITSQNTNQGVQSPSLVLRQRVTWGDLRRSLRMRCKRNLPQRVLNKKSQPRVMAPCISAQKGEERRLCPCLSTPGNAKIMAGHRVFFLKVGTAPQLGRESSQDCICSGPGSFPGCLRTLYFSSFSHWPVSGCRSRIFPSR